MIPSLPKKNSKIKKKFKKSFQKRSCMSIPYYVSIPPLYKFLIAKAYVIL